ncbi:uncharacterized protein LOC114251482 [Bombyx mandarina]|uniref:Uncharacterized protein LOC114251482 n=1 Tax=Bombyx mandarina TaxID=7092 RepID=A0A6J2KJ42_BOMMA|nr:uncharacterized protein LOC114251482 [Bombyx mandarina]
MNSADFSQRCRVSHHTVVQNLLEEQGRGVHGSVQWPRPEQLHMAHALATSSWDQWLLIRTSQLIELQKEADYFQQW